MSRTRGLPLLALAAACSDGTVALPPGAAGSGSGTRLRAQSVVAVEGGARHLLQIVDLRTAQPCTIAPRLPGEAAARCFPSAVGMLVHLDPDCTSPHVETTQPGHPWMSAYDANQLVHVHLGERVSGGQRYHSNGPGHCAPYEGQTGGELYTITERLAETDLVQGTITRAPVNARLTATRFAGDDGSDFLLDLTDETSGASCAPSPTAAGARCRPDQGELSHEGLFDERCERIAVLEYGSVAVASLRGEQGEDLGVFRFEAASREARVGRKRADGSCAAEDVEEGRKTLHFGVPYPAEAWPEVGLDTFGGPRVTSRAATAPRGADAFALRRVDPRALLDDQGAPCGPVWVDGVLRCLPAPPAGLLYWPGLFADARCSVPAVAAGADVARPEVMTFVEGATGPSQGSLPSGRAYAVGEEQRTTYQRRGDACVPDNVTAAKLFPLTGPLDPSRFAELSLVTD